MCRPRLQRHARRVGMSISAEWYLLVTSPDGQSVFATMGPYPTEADAERVATFAKLGHYQVKLAIPTSGTRVR
jgi:hypothetical protein